MSLNATVTRPTRANPMYACVTTLALVFLCGVAVGAVAMNLGVHKPLHRAAFGTEAAKSLYLDRLKKDLDLTPVQAEQMATILDDFSQYYRNVLSDGRSRMMQILNPDQQRKFELILQQRSR